MGVKPCVFTCFGASKCLKPYGFMCFGDSKLLKPCVCIDFGAVRCLKPNALRGLELRSAYNVVFSYV